MTVLHHVVLGVPTQAPDSNRRCVSQSLWGLLGMRHVAHSLDPAPAPREGYLFVCWPLAGATVQWESNYMMLGLEGQAMLMEDFLLE